MAVTEVTGKKFIQVDLGTTGGDWVMSREAVIREVRLTEIMPRPWGSWNCWRPLTKRLSKSSAISLLKFAGVWIEDDEDTTHDNNEGTV
jgi:hypothetical protein